MKYQTSKIIISLCINIHLFSSCSQYKTHQMDPNQESLASPCKPLSRKRKQLPSIDQSQQLAAKKLLKRSVSWKQKAQNESDPLIQACNYPGIESAFKAIIDEHTDGLITFLKNNKENMQQQKKLEPCCNNLLKFSVVKNKFESLTTLIQFIQSEVPDRYAVSDCMYHVFTDAIVNNSLDLVKKLIQSGMSTTVSDFETENTPLHVAAKYGRLEIIKELLKEELENMNRNSSMNQTDNKGNTPLHIAIKHGHYELAKYLIDNKADVNAQNNLEKTPLYIAVEKGHLDIFTYLVSLNSPGTIKVNINIPDVQGDSPLICALQNYDHDIPTLVSFLRPLLQQDSSLYKYDSDDADETALHIIPRIKDNQLIVNLLGNELKNENIMHIINKKGKKGRTPLHCAVKHNNLSMVRYLLERRANISIKDKFNKTAYDYAKEKPTIRFLLETYHIR